MRTILLRAGACAIALLAAVVPDSVHAAASLAPVISKSFGPATTGIGVVSRLTLTLTNPNPNSADTLYNIQFTDTYPVGLVNAPTPGITNTCGGNTTTDVVGGTAGGNTIGLQGGNNDLAGGASCTVGVNVVSATAGTYNNNTGPVTGCRNDACPASQLLIGNQAGATLTVAGVAVSKAFNPTVILVNGVSALTVTLTNPTGGAFTAVGFTDTFPALPGAMTLANTVTASSCGGTVTDSGGGALDAGDVGVRLTGGSLGAGASCTVTVNVTAATSGIYTNTIPINGATSSGGGNTTAAASANLTVSPAPVITKASSVLSDPVNGAASPKRVPGATIQYTVVVSNASGLAPITVVVASDPIPANTTYVAGSIAINGIAEDDNNAGADETDPNGADFGVTAGGTVTARIASIAAGASATVTFRVTVN